jgi:hypothetical protein
METKMGYDEAAFEAYLDSEADYVEAAPSAPYDPEAQADLELHDFLHPDGYHG